MLEDWELNTAEAVSKQKMEIQRAIMNFIRQTEWFLSILSKNDIKAGDRVLFMA